MKTRLNIKLIDSTNDTVKYEEDTHNDVTDATYKTIKDNIKPNTSYTENAFSVSSSTSGAGNLYFGKRDNDAPLYNLACNYKPMETPKFQPINNLYTVNVSPSYSKLDMYKDRIETTYVFNTDVVIPEFDTFGKGYVNNNRVVKSSLINGTTCNGLTWWYGLYDVVNNIYWGAERVNANYYDLDREEYVDYVGYDIFTFNIDASGNIYNKNRVIDGFPSNWPANYCVGLSKDFGLYSIQGKNGILYIYNWDMNSTASGKPVLSVKNQYTLNYAAYENTQEFKHDDGSNTGTSYIRSMYDININDKKIIVAGQYYIVLDSSGSTYYAQTGYNIAYCTELQSFVFVGWNSNNPSQVIVYSALLVDMSNGIVYTKYVDYSRIKNLYGVIEQRNKDSYNNTGKGSELYIYNGDGIVQRIVSSTDNINSEASIDTNKAESIDNFDNNYGVATVITTNKTINKENDVLIIKYTTYF